MVRLCDVVWVTPDEKNLPANVKTPPSAKTSITLSITTPTTPPPLHLRARVAHYLLLAADNLPYKPVVAQCHPYVFLPFFGTETEAVDTDLPVDMVDDAVAAREREPSFTPCREVSKSGAQRR